MAKRKPGKGPKVSYPSEPSKPSKTYTAGRSARGKGKTKSWVGSS